MGYFAETFNDIYQSLNEEGHRIGAARDSSNLKNLSANPTTIISNSPYPISATIIPKNNR